MEICLSKEARRKPNSVINLSLTKAILNQLVWFSMLLAATACTQEKRANDNVVLDNACFKNISEADEYLPKLFVDSLFLNGDKNKIINLALNIGLKPRKNEFASITHCDYTSMNPEVYSMPIIIDDPTYVGGRLDIYFDSDQLKAADFSLIKLP